MTKIKDEYVESDLDYLMEEFGQNMPSIDDDLDAARDKPKKGKAGRWRMAQQDPVQEILDNIDEID